MLDELNALLGRTWEKLVGSSARFRYYEDKKGNMYAWTTEKVRDPKTGKERYAAIYYRYYKLKKRAVAKKTVYFARRNKAKARALTWYLKAKARQV
jgi:hypothetical protein